MAKQKRALYRPHTRLQFDGSHPDTGEIMPSMTKQEFKRECDINNIIKHFSQTGMVNHIAANAAKGAYLDLPDNLDFQESLALVAEAEKAFMSLPSKVRDKFGQDPAEFLAFASDPKNLEEMRALGLAPALPPEASAPGGGEGGNPPPFGGFIKPHNCP